MFFTTHECNEHCRALGLVNPRTDSKLPPNFNRLIADPEEGKNIPASQTIKKLCDVCRVPFETTYGDYQIKRGKEWELWCDICTQKCKSHKKVAKCKNCLRDFKSQTYWWLMKKSELPEICIECRKEKREKLRAQLEGRQVDIPEVYKPEYKKIKKGKGQGKKSVNPAK